METTIVVAVILAFIALILFLVGLTMKTERQLIMAKASAQKIREAAFATGMRTLKQDGILKVLEGTTTLAEVNSVCSR